MKEFVVMSCLYCQHAWHCAMCKVIVQKMARKTKCSEWAKQGEWCLRRIVAKSNWAASQHTTEWLATTCISWSQIPCSKSKEWPWTMLSELHRKDSSPSTDFQKQEVLTTIKKLCAYTQSTQTQQLLSISEHIPATVVDTSHIQSK